MKGDKSLMNIGVVFGGMSAEHEVSWMSARNVVNAMDPARYCPVPVVVDKLGGWFLLEPGELFSDRLVHEEDGELKVKDLRALIPERKVLLDPEGEGLPLLLKGDREEGKTLDVVFPLVHGPNGEDGTLQGLCKIYQVPFVGPGVMASSACMDKEMTKRILRERGIPGPGFEVYSKQGEGSRLDLEKIPEQLGLPLFVKPANLGSSVGITKAKSAEELRQAVSYALRFDDKVVLETFVEGREIECSVLGNQDPIASVPGEIIPSHEFYSYQAKYLDPRGAELRIPADLPPEVAARVQKLAVESFVALGCEGMARVDFFVRDDGSVLVNELNTIPGFTNISMYPKLLEASGIPCTELVHRLICLGLERFQRETAYSCEWNEPLA